MIKIIGGEFRSRQLEAPPESDVTRPYSGRAREAVFNLLRGWFEDASVIDLFAGVGSMGIEAISRGASSVVLVEHNKRVYEMLARNIDHLQCEDRAQTVFGDALGSACLLRAQQPVQIVFIDPPYALMREEAGRSRVFAQMVNCKPILDDPSFVVLRTPENPDSCGDAYAVPGFAGPEVHRYGADMFVLLYQPVHSESGFEDD